MSHSDGADADTSIVDMPDDRPIVDALSGEFGHLVLP